MRVSFMKQFYLAMLLFFTVAQLFGQDCHFSIRGRVIDKHDKKPLSGAILNIYGLKKEVFTNKEGYFVLNGICEGFIELEVAHPACSTVFYPLQITKNITQDFFLEHHIEALQEVALVQKKTTIPTTQKMNQTQIDRNVGSNFAEALTNIQGIATLQTGNSIAKPLVQGFVGSRIVTRNQGVRMQDMEWGDEHAPNIATSSVRGVSFLVGAQALKYGGDAVGGVLVLDQKKPSYSNEFKGKAIFNGATNGKSYQGSISLEQDKETGQYYGFQMDVKKAGDTHTPSYYMKNTGVEQLSLSIPFGWHSNHWGLDGYVSYFKTTNAILANSHIGSISDLIANINGLSPVEKGSFSYNIANPKQEVGHFLAKISGYKRYENLGKLTLQYDYQQNNRLEYDIRLGDRNAIPATDLNLQTHSILNTFKFSSPQSKSLEIGLESRYQIHFPNPDTGVKRLIPDYNNFSVGSFVEGSTTFKNYWRATAALRSDYQHVSAEKYYKKSRWESLGYDTQFPDFVVERFSTQILTAPVLNYLTFSGAISLSYAKNNNAFKTHYQYIERPPNPAELFSEGLHHSAARIELGALDLVAEKAHKISFSYQWDTPKGNFYIAPFFNRINDYIALISTGVEFTIRGAFPVWEYQQTNARFIGVDIKHAQNWMEGLKTTHALSVVKAKDLLNNSPFPNIPPVSTTHEIKKSFTNLPGFSLRLQGSYFFEQNETPDNLEIYNPYSEQEEELKINDAPPAYLLLSGGLEYLFPKKGKANYGIRLFGENLANTTYRNYLNRLRYFSDEMGVNINLQFTLNF